MSYVIVLQGITVLLCLIYGVRPYVKHFIIGAVSVNAVIAACLFFPHLSGRSASYISVSELFLGGNLGILADSLSVTSIWVISVLSAIITCFSYGFFTKRLREFLCCFHALVFVLMLFICSNNLLQLYIFAELITIFTYFLIRFDSNSEAPSKFVQFLAANRFGNALILLALIFIHYTFNSLSFERLDDVIISNDTLLRQNEWSTFLLTAGVLIKTAQICSSRWIKTTMSAPLPAAIIIHTAIAMNVFIIIRLQNLFEYNELAQNILIVSGLATAVWCAVKALHSRSLNDMLAYSASSQIGLMVTACGFSAYGAALIIFAAYAFSKLLLFLSVGSVNYALSGETRLENMGGLFELLPKTYISFIIATISLINIPLLPSYYAKKQFISEIIAGNSPMYYSAVFAVLVASIFLCTCLFRIIYLIFHGETRVSEIDLAYVNENNHYINISLYISAFFALFSGVFFYYFVLTDVMWKDVFVLTYESYPSAIWAFSTANFAGIAGALFMCKNVRPANLDFCWKLNFLKKINIEALLCKIKKIHIRKPVSISFHIDNRLLLLIFFLLLFFQAVRG